MAARPIIRVGDGTSHGGTVLQGFPFYNIFGRHAAGMGHLVQCPQCQGAFPIIEGVSTFSIHGGHVAIEGMKTSCGATLIASQKIALVDPGIGGIVRAPDALMTLANGLGGGAAPQQGSLSNSPRRADCHHADTAIPLAEYIVREMKTNPFTPQGKKIAAANSYDPNARLAEWQQLPWYARVGRPPDFHATAAGQKAAAYAMWTERVGPGRPWDHKPTLQKKIRREPTPSLAQVRRP
ncbi:PAAR domain-containing protein [Achromobacter mucicolens]|uniref:PAAR domain-containing protein n=1 Tax=Achromobacter mucicolens TaxID=1389922 RepID=UPI002448FCD7|nr:PAAR domain-containing protein [Achromobacter mucicolens]MDH0091784.1 PAAR domain-containing protein [Achromobacter mucicolens]